MDLVNLIANWLIPSIVGLVIMYYLIRFAVSGAVSKYLKIQSGIMRHNAKQQGMSDAEIDKLWMSEDDWNKTYGDKK
jgi:hypothetical protein